MAQSRVLKMQVYKNKYLCLCEYKNIILVQIILIFSSIFDGESWSLEGLSFVSGSIGAWSRGAPAGAFF